MFLPRPALRLFGISLLARTPFAAAGLLLIVRTKELTGSYAASGLVAAVATTANALSAPVLGRVVDRRGQTLVLQLCAALAGAALTGFALVPDGTPLAALLACATLYGVAMPPLGACLRTLYPALLDGECLHRAYALESAALEITYIVGPLLLLGVAATAGAATALFAAAGLLGAGTLAFAATPESRAWRASSPNEPTGGGAIRSRGMRTIVIAVGLAGATFGAIEVAVPAASQAAGAKGATGPLLALWGLGSMLGGLLAARAAAPPDAARFLALLLAALGIADLALVPITSPAALAPILLVAGAAIAPLFATAYGLVDRVAPEGRATEAFSWMSTAVSIGLASGSALAGGLVDAAGPSAGFAVAATLGLVAGAVTAARRSSLPALAPARA